MRPDDIIGTLGRLAEKDSFDVTIVSGECVDPVDRWHTGGRDFPRKVWLSLR